VGAYFAYFGVYLKAMPGGSSNWGQLGDYVGGLINPIVGIVTVVLVIRTLRVTRQEAKETRYQLELQTEHLEKQVRHFEQQQILDSIRKKLDGVLVDWKAAMDLSILDLHLVSRESGEPYFADKEFRSTWQLLYDPDLPGLLRGMRKHRLYTSFHANWHQRFEPCLMLLDELDEYCSELDAASGDPKLANFYRRRIQLPLRAFRAVGIAGDDEFKSLNVGIKQRCLSAN
jgi:hypothetical protein